MYGTEIGRMSSLVHGAMLSFKNLRLAAHRFRRVHRLEALVHHRLRQVLLAPV